MKILVRLGGDVDELEVLEQNTMYVTLPSVLSLTTSQPLPRPSLRWTGGKKAPLFPLYVQCRSRKDVEDVQKIHRPLLNLYTGYSGDKEIARAIHRHLDCSSVMSNITMWYCLLNGRNFRGILSSERYVLFLPKITCVKLIPSNSDLDSLTRDYQYSSCREVGSFKDAILIMVLKGEKSLLTEVKGSSPPLSPTISDLDHLTISSLSVQDEGMVHFNIY